MSKRQNNLAADDKAKKSKMELDTVAAKWDDHYFEILYMETRARAEVPRMMMEWAGVKYTSRAPVDWKTTGKKLAPFGRLPILTHFKPDGTKLVLPEVMAISRYLGKLFGLGGETAEEEAFIDAMFSSATDNILSVMIHELWNKPDPTDKQVIEKTFKELQEIFTGFETYLAQNGSNGYFVGEKTTYADFPLFDWLEFFFTTYPEQCKTLVTETHRPAIWKLFCRIGLDPRISEYIQAGRWKKSPSTPFLGIYSAGIQSKDWRKSLEFYRDILGMKCVLNKDPMNPTGTEETEQRYLEFVSVGSNATRFSIYCSGDKTKEIKTISNHVSFLVKDVQATYDSLLAKGVNFTMKPVTASWGSMTQFTDPDGNSITINSDMRAKDELLTEKEA